MAKGKIVVLSHYLFDEKMRELGLNNQNVDYEPKFDRAKYANENAVIQTYSHAPNYGYCGILVTTNSYTTSHCTS